MKKILHLVIGCLVPLFLMEGEIYSQDIEGLEIGSKATKIQVVNKFGTPDRYEIQHWGDGPYEKGEFFKYDIDSIDSHKEGLYIELMDDELTTFVISNSKYRAFMNTIPGGILVGDSFSTLNGYFIFEKIRNRSGGEYYRAYTTEYGHVITITLKDDKISRISGVVGQ